MAQSIKSLLLRPSGITDRALTWMATDNPPLALLDLPDEILEYVVLQFHAQEILRLRIVMWFLCGLSTLILYLPSPLPYLVS